MRLDLIKMKPDFYLGFLFFPHNYAEIVSQATGGLGIALFILMHSMP